MNCQIPCSQFIITFEVVSLAQPTNTKWVKITLCTAELNQNIPLQLMYCSFFLQPSLFQEQTRKSCSEKKTKAALRYRLTTIIKLWYLMAM